MAESESTDSTTAAAAIEAPAAADDAATQQPLAAAAATTATSSKPTTTRKRSRRSTPATLWREFQFQYHSLSINASEVAACAGFHDYKSLPELLMKQVYQGYGGQALLQHDANLLGITIVDEEEQLLEIATLAGPATKNALNQALQVKRGERVVENVERAQQMRNKVVQEATASKKLNPQQLATLQEKTRYSIDTGCGHSWEDEALDQYEKLCGWEVRERNAECRVWHFQKCANVECDSNDSVPSLQPVGAALPRQPYKRKQEYRDAEGDVAMQISKDSLESASMVDLTGEDDDVDDAPSTDDTSRPFLSIKGMIDGIRDELTPAISENDDDSWFLRRVVVECKHRMRAISSYPRLYECIQAVIYCQMYEAEEADIVQVLRRGSGNDKPVNETKPDPQESDQAKALSETNSTQQEALTSPERKRLLTDYFNRIPSKTTTESDSIVNADNNQQPSEMIDGTTMLKAAATSHESTVEYMEEKKENSITDNVSSKEKKEVSKASTNMEITVSRVSLHDHFEHMRHWNSVILPRLGMWADSVYKVRQSDELRYRLLIAMTAEQQDLESAWQLVFELCPFLREGVSFDCYKREVS